MAGGSRCCPHSLGDCGPVPSLGHAPLSPFLGLFPCSSSVLRSQLHPGSQLDPGSQLAARQDCQWAMVFCKALSDSPVGLLKHLVSLSQRHYELININSPFWYLLLPGALAWAFLFPFPQTEMARSRLPLAESQREATWLGGHELPIPVPVLHRDKGCCQALTSLLGLGPGGAPVLPCHHQQLRAWVLHRWVTPAAPSLTSASPQGCEAGDAGAVLWGKDFRH